MRKIRISIVFSILLIFSGVLIFGSGALDEAYAQRSAGTSEDSAPRLLPGGWINSISEEFIIINDTQYVLTGQTRFPDGLEALKEGEFVRFKSDKGKVLSEIYLAEPRKREMYMQPVIIGSTENETSQDDDGVISPTSEGAPDNGGMRLENGVWVN